MSRYNKKTVDFGKFHAYLVERNKMSFYLRPYYRSPLFRKLRLGSYIGRQRSESGLINNLKKTFGDADKVVLCIGDWSQKQHMRHHAPVKGKGLRKVLRKAGYVVLLVKEYRTSRQCSLCADNRHRLNPIDENPPEYGRARQGNDIGKLVSFRWVKNKKPKSKREHRFILCRGLLKCVTCAGIVNRDVNASSNIWLLAYNAIHGKGRPNYLKGGMTAEERAAEEMERAQILLNMQV